MIFAFRLSANVFWYPKEQTGLFADQGGYDVKVGAHTQPDSAVIGSRAGADKNRLETGTLGFSDLHNALHFNVQQASESDGSSMRVILEILMWNIYIVRSMTIIPMVGR